MKQLSFVKKASLLAAVFVILLVPRLLESKCPGSCHYDEVFTYMFLPEGDCNKDWDDTWAYGTVWAPSEKDTTGMLDNGYAPYGAIDVEVQEFDPVLGWVTIFGVSNTKLACIDINRPLKCTDYRFRWRKASSPGSPKCPAAVICFVYKSDPNNYCN
jgi:hypothetical protein